MQKILVDGRQFVAQHNIQILDHFPVAFHVIHSPFLRVRTKMSFYYQARIVCGICIFSRARMDQTGQEGREEAVIRLRS
jgi:hypothetical protein